MLTWRFTLRSTTTITKTSGANAPATTLRLIVRTTDERLYLLTAEVSSQSGCRARAVGHRPWCVSVNGVETEDRE